MSKTKAIIQQNEMFVLLIITTDLIYSDKSSMMVESFAKVIKNTKRLFVLNKPLLKKELLRATPKIKR